MLPCLLGGGFLRGSVLQVRSSQSFSCILEWGMSVPIILVKDCKSSCTFMLVKGIVPAKLFTEST